MQFLCFEIWEESHGLVERGILVEVEHVKAHGTKKEKENMSQFEKFVTEGNEKADDFAKAGAMLDEGIHGGSKSKDNAAGKRGGVRSFAVFGQLPLPGGGMERL